MSNYYWYENKKIPLDASPTQKAVRFSDTASPAALRSTAASLGASSANSTGLDLGNGIILYNTDANTAAFSAASSANATLPANSKQLPVFKTADDTTLILTDEFNVQFKPNVTRDQINQLNTKHNVNVVRESEWERNGFILSVDKNAQVDALELANIYHESDLTEYAEPNFVRLIKPVHTLDNPGFQKRPVLDFTIDRDILKQIPLLFDPLFPQQWALRNTGQRGGIAGQDISAPAAWEISRGANTTIAILDEGVDYSHPDFSTAGKLVTGYDAITRTNNPNPINNDAHGTAAAGIAAAGRNRFGILGVAPDARILGIRIAYGTVSNGRRIWVTSNAQIADGINTAVARGADVLSNSWGGGTPSTQITNAIRNARNTGRGGRGAVVIFAAGNDNSAVSYPGNLPEVITVAAINQWGERKSPTSRDGENWWGSNFGPEIDVSAPGVHIVTTDISGTRGYSTDNYTNTFNGTSAATPHVAGVAALVLSVNPALSGAEVERILRSSTDDLGNHGYDVFTGFGRINAHKAVLAAQLRWDNPRAIPGWFGHENQGSDIAAADINGNGRSDLLVFHIDNPGGANQGYYRIGWNLDNFGVAQSWSPIKAVPGWFGAENQGAGVALADINGNGSKDLLVFHIDNPAGANHGYYRVGWNLNAAGDPTGGWSPVKAVPGWFGAENQGAGVALADINGNGSQDLIVYHIDNPGGENHGYYRIGWNLNAAGDVTGGWSDIKPIPGWFGSENQGGGIAVADINGDGRPELIVFHLDNPGGANRGYYRIGWKLDTAGNVTGGWSDIRPVPGWFGAENQGGGIAVTDINGDGRKDLIVHHDDNPSGANSGYYRIGWNLLS